MKFSYIVATKRFVAVAGSGMDKKQDPGSGINIPDPQHCSWDSPFKTARPWPEDGLEHVGGQVLAGVDALVLLHKHVRRDLHLGVGVVQRRVQHDDREGQDETGVGFWGDITFVKKEQKKFHTTVIGKGQPLLTTMILWWLTLSAIVGLEHRNTVVFQVQSPTLFQRKCVQKVRFTLLKK